MQLLTYHWWCRTRSPRWDRPRGSRSDRGTRAPRDAAKLCCANPDAPAKNEFGSRCRIAFLGARHVLEGHADGRAPRDLGLCGGWTEEGDMTPRGLSHRADEPQRATGSMMSRNCWTPPGEHVTRGSDVESTKRCLDRVHNRSRCTPQGADLISKARGDPMNSWTFVE